MKKFILVLGVVVSGIASATASAVEKCEQKAIHAATVFQNEIVGEMLVDTASVLETYQKEDVIEYIVQAVNKSGTRIREMAVETDINCNVRSIKQ